MLSLNEFLVKKHQQYNNQYDDIIICDVKFEDMYEVIGICNYSDSMFNVIIDDVYDNIIKLKNNNENERFTILQNICEKLNNKYNDFHFIANSYITYNKDIYKGLYKGIKKLKTKNKYFGIYVQNYKTKEEQFLIVI